MAGGAFHKSNARWREIPKSAAAQGTADAAVTNIRVDRVANQFTRRLAAATAAAAASALAARRLLAAVAAALFFKAAVAPGRAATIFMHNASYSLYISGICMVITGTLYCMPLDEICSLRLNRAHSSNNKIVKIHSNE